MEAKLFSNPFRPGAGHMPPYLAGRTEELERFRKLLHQDVILQNVVLTGLRGVGKTVLLETFKPPAREAGWLWAGTDLSESAAVDERSMAIRLITDLSVITSAIRFAKDSKPAIGFNRSSMPSDHTFDFQNLARFFEETPGLVSDKLKAVLEFVWAALPTTKQRGIIFAYDEAQNMADHSEKDQYPLSVLLDVFQSIQKKGVMFMLVLTGLPTLFPKLVNARTYAERMFTVISIDRLNREHSREAVTRPIANCPKKFSPTSVDTIVQMSGGYPYFLQFICREVYDIWIGQTAAGQPLQVPIDAIQRKLDSDFFSGRWTRVTDRQRELLTVVARLPSAETEFTVQEVVDKAREMLPKPFSSSHVSQILNSLSDAGLIYKNRHGKYSLAVPLLNRFILRQSPHEGSSPASGHRKPLG